MIVGVLAQLARTSLAGIAPASAGFDRDMTSIEWTDKTWNPLIGCSRVAKRNGKSGCDHCDAEGQVNRFQARYDRASTIKLGASKRPGLTFTPTDPDGATLGKGARWTGSVWLLPDVLDVPLRRRKPTQWFVNSQSDVFHESVVDTEEGRRFIAAMFGVMAACPQHTFQILTKRPAKMREWFDWLATADFRVRAIEANQTACNVSAAATELLRPRHVESDDRLWRMVKQAPVNLWPLPNVWIGTSVEDQESANERIPEVLRVPAAVRFLSCEPLLGPVDLSEWIAPVDRCCYCESERDGIGEDHCDECGEDGSMITTWGSGQLERLRSGDRYAEDGPHDDDDGPSIHWIIAGGESGNGARPMHPDWARSARDQALEAGVPFFFKQWGEWGVKAESDDVIKLPFFGESEAHLVWVSDTPSPVMMRRIGKRKAGRELDGRTWDQFPEVDR